MVELLAADDARGYGIAAALALEGIPFRRVSRLEAASRDVLVVARPVAPADVAALDGRRPIAVVGPLEGEQPPTCHPMARIGLDEPLWPADVCALAARHGMPALTLPSAWVARGRGITGQVLSGMVLGDGSRVPAVVRAGSVVRALLDVGTALAVLLGEAHVPVPDRRAVRGMVGRIALATYYRAPERLRRMARQRGYAGMAERLDALGARASAYPVDATGWLLLELVKALVRAAAGPLVRLARWPAPFTSAATLTHDIEPTRFAYGTGLRRLCEQLARSGHAPTFGLVAAPTKRWLAHGVPAAVDHGDVACHGLEHRGETLVGSREAIRDGLLQARDLLARQLHRPIAGFRSPRLDRSPALLWALDQAGFAWDSSYPDVDRENVDHVGGGVRLCLPYRPPVLENSSVRPSRCLELPVSAPDCIQPLFQGDDLRGLRRAVRAKTRFVRDTGGLYVGIVHAGVFDERDARRRGAHLAFVHRQVAHPDVWLASATDVVRWWTAREAVALTVAGDTAVVENHGEASLAGLTITVEQPEGELVIPVPTLAPGARASVALDLAPRAAREGRP